MKARALNAAVPSFDDLGHLEWALERAFAAVLAEAGRRAAARFEEFAGHALVAAPGVGSSTAMVAVYPSAEQQALVARQGGEDPDVIHCTLAFLGEVDPDQAEAAVAAVARVAGERSPLEGEVGGVAVFGDNGDGHPSIVLPDVDGLAELRHAVCEALDEAGVFRATNHGWTPHLTLSYEEEPRTPPAALIGLPLSFDSLSVSVGDVRRDLALGGGLGRHSAADAEPAAEREAVSAAGPPSWTQPHPDELVNVDDLIRKFRTKADPVRLAAIEAAAGPALKAAGIDFDATNPLIDAVYARVGQHIAYVAETTRLNAMRIVRRSYEEGLSIPDTAKAIREGMTAASAVRATLIARTEMTSLTNGGSLAAARIIDDELSRARDDGEPDAQDFGGYRKRWLTAPGAHFPRHEDYEGLDGQTVGLDEFFDVGGEQLLYPGDPAGPPEEVCNCRCTLVYVDAGGEETDGGEADSMGASGAAVPFTGDLEGGADVKPKKTTPEEALAADLADEAAAAELAPPQDDVPAPMEGDCANCGHGAADHAGEMNDGACEVDGCDCEAMVEADASPDSEENSGGMTAFVRIRPEVDPEFYAEVENATKSAMRSGMIAAFFGDESGPHGTSGPSGATFDVVESVPADVRPERSDEIVQPEVELRTSAQQRWEAEFCPEGYATDDGRIFAPGSIGWRDLPLSLMAMTETPGEGGHAGAKLAGRIERIWRDESSVPTMIRAEGTFDDGEYGDEIARLVGDQTLRGNSVDLAIRRAEFGPRAIYVDDAGLWRDDAPADGEAPEPSLEELLDGDVAMVVREARIGMSTVCPFPAFDNAGIVLVAATDSSPAFAVEEQGGIHWRIWLKDSVRPQGDVVTASADGLVPVQPPAEWFDDPELDELTPLTVTEDGRVFGHAWSWNECHIGFPGTCVVAPRSNTGYAYFHLKQVECDDGAFVDVGTITLGTGHADQRATPQAAAEHYDNTGTAVADVRIYEDEFGGAVAGALRPDVAAGRVRELRGSTPSGDWRKRNGNLELVGLLAVNVPGFPVPRTRALVASSEGGEAEVLALVAAGIPERPAGVGYVEFVDAADRARLAALAARAEGGLEALARLAASGEVLVAAPVWDSENGLMDVMGDVAAALNPGDSWRWYVLDVSIGGESAIVCDGEENTFWLVPLGYDDVGEPVVPPQSEWTEVESEWVAAEAASAFARFARERLAALADRAAA